MVLRQTRAAGSMQRQSEPSAKRRADALVLKGSYTMGLEGALQRRLPRTPLRNTVLFSQLQQGMEAPLSIPAW